jgi:hypothetical protein
VVDLIQRAIGSVRRTFILANNKAEGSAPLTLRGIAEQCVAAGVGR